MSSQESFIEEEMYVHIGSHDWFYSKIAYKFSAEEIKMLNYMLRLAAAEMFRDKNIAEHREEMAVALAEEIQAHVIMYSNIETTKHLAAVISLSRYNNLTDEQKSLYIPISGADPDKQFAFEKLYAPFKNSNREQR